MITLSFEKRDVKSNLHKLRKSGKIPAVLYGRVQKSTSISVSEKDFMKIWKQAGETSVINLQGDGLSSEALIYATNRDPISGVFRHADFYAIEKGRKLRIKVPLIFSGVAPATKELGGIVIKVLHEVEIEAAPKDFPHSIEINLNSLVDFDSQILAKEIKVPSGVTLINALNEVVASVAKPVEEKEEEVVVDLSQIEVEKKGKTEDAEEVALEAETKETKDGAKTKEGPKNKGSEGPR